MLTKPISIYIILLVPMIRNSESVISFSFSNHNSRINVGAPLNSVTDGSIPIGSVKFLQTLSIID
jgi:hypothetical protein